MNILFLIVSVFLNVSFHDLHMSKAELNYKSDQRALQLTVHLFIDDLEKGLQMYGDDKLRLFENNESPQADSLINLYINEFLIVDIDDTKVKLSYLGKEMSDDLEGAWCYLEVENVNPFNIISVRNELLTSIFDDQKNIINIKVNSKSKAFHILDKEDNFKVIRI